MIKQKYRDMDKDSVSRLEVRSCKQGVTFAIYNNGSRLHVTLDLVSTGVLTSQLIKFAIDTLEKKGDREFFRGFNI